MIAAILARFGYFPREYARIRLGDDAIARGARWEAFYREEGGLADMVRGLRQEAFEEWAKARFGDYDARDRLAMKDEALVELGRKVQTIIETGKLATAARADADRIAAVRR